MARQLDNIRFNQQQHLEISQSSATTVVSTEPPKKMLLSINYYNLRYNTEREMLFTPPRSYVVPPVRCLHHLPGRRQAALQRAAARR